MKHTPVYTHSDYMNYALQRENTDIMIDAALSTLKHKRFDAIAFRGMSGELVAPILARELQKTLILVRKPNSKESAHSWHQVEGDEGAESYIIVDDFVDSGATLRAIYDYVSYFSPQAQCRGALLYKEMMRGTKTLGWRSAASLRRHFISPLSRHEKSVPESVPF